MMWAAAREEFLQWKKMGRDPIIVKLSTGPEPPETYDFYVFDRLTYQEHINAHINYARRLKSGA